MLYEISRRSINTSKNKEISLQWHNSVLSVSTEKGMQLLDFSYNLECLDKNIEFNVSLIPTPKSSPATGLFPDRYLKYGLTNADITQMILDPGLWPHNAQLTNEMASIVTYEWSPVGMIYGNHCLIAILTNVGNIELFGPERNKWESKLNLSEVIKKYYLPCISSNIIRNLEDVKNTVNVVETCAIRWGPNIEDNTCYFVTAQKNGKILIWMLQSQGTEIETDLRGEIPTDIGEIFSMIWIPKANNTFLLICSNVMGQIFALDCQMIKNQIEVVNTFCLWTHKDRMLAKYLTYKTIDDKIILLCNKHRHLIVQTLDNNCEIISQVVKNVNDYRITDITDSKDGLYLVTINCKIYKIDLIISVNNLDVNLTLIETKDEYATYDLHSLKISNNNILWAAVMVDREIKCRKYPEKIDLIFFSTDLQNHSETTLLLENPTKQLTDYWDCIELLRYKTMKLKALPPIDYLKLYSEANSDSYKMKLYYIFVNLYNVLENVIKNNSKGLLPETSVEIIRDKIRLSQAITLLNNYHKNSSEMLNGYELEYYCGAKKYLEYYCHKYERCLNEFVTSNALNLTKMVPQYICQGCEEIIEGFSCKIPFHFNMFCSITFTPIENDYIACKSCNSTARSELCDAKPMCLFCDLYLSNSHVP